MSLGITGSKLCPRLRLEVVRGWWGGWSRATQAAGAPAPHPAGTPPAGSGPLLPPPSPSPLPQGPRAGAQSLQEAGLGWSVQCTLRGCAWGWALPPGLVPDHRGVRTGEGPALQREDSSGDTSVCLHRQHMSVSMWPEDVVCVIPDLESFSSPHPRALRSAQ